MRGYLPRIRAILSC